MNKDDLKKIAEAAFAHNKTADALIVASDGTCFLPAHQNAAEEHARREKLTLETYTRSGEVSNIPVTKAEKEAAKKDAAKLKADLEELEQLRKDLPELEKAHEELLQKNLALEKDHEELKTVHEKVCKNVDDLIKASEDVMEENKILTEDIEAANNHINSLERNIKDLTEENEKLKATKPEAGKK